MRFKGFDLRSDDHIKSAISRSNVVINLLNLEKETPNFSFEDVHVDAAARIARHAAQNPTTELFWQGSCLAASEQSPSRRLRSLVSHARCHVICMTIAGVMRCWQALPPLPQWLATCMHCTTVHGAAHANNNSLSSSHCPCASESCMICNTQSHADTVKAIRG